MEDVERGLFRYISSVQVSLFDVMKKFWFEINDGEPDHDISVAIDKINSVIKRYELEISRGKCEVSGIEYAALINMTKSNISERAKFFDKKTKLLFSKIIENCVLADGFISDITCGNLSSLAEMSKTAAQAAIADLADKKWLEIQRGTVYLGVRSITELGQLLLQTFPEQVKQCSLCRNIICYGKTCPSCGEKGHNYCLSRFWERQQICPNCKASWSGSVGSVSQASDTSEEEESSMQPTRRKRSRLISEDDSS